MRALIYKSTGNFYLAKDTTGAFQQCRFRGKFKIDKEISTTNPIAVGDWVTLGPDRDSEGIAMIVSVEERKNYIIRAAIHHPALRHIIAANMDLAILVATLKNPFTSQGFMDRFLVTAEAYHIPALIVFNKADTHQGNTVEAWENKKHILEKAGYPTLTVSAETGSGISELKKYIQDKISLFSGHSGVGKSTLINALSPDFQLKTGAVSDYNEKGKHTTSFAAMYDLPFGGQIIDTPGIKELGLVDIGKGELSHYFPEMASKLNDCKFNNCIHLNEPGCAIKEAVMKGQICSERYQSYISLLEDLS